MTLNITKEVQLERIRRLLALFDAGKIPTLAQHEVYPDVPPGSRENYLYFTLPVCINFQRSSPAMWVAALRTWEDPRTHYVFFPEKLAGVSSDKIRADLTKYNLALQPNRHVWIWTTIARTLHECYDDDPRRLLLEAGYDAEKLINLLQETHKSRFPYLSGPKLSNYWPYILSHFTDVRFQNAHAISIIPDTHVIKASVHLGLVPPGAGSVMVEAVWRDLLGGSGITPSQVHPVLWNWSRNRFMPEID